MRVKPLKEYRSAGRAQVKVHRERDSKRLLSSDQQLLCGVFDDHTWRCPRGCCELEPVWISETSSWALLWTAASAIAEPEVQLGLLAGRAQKL